MPKQKKQLFDLSILTIIKFFLVLLGLVFLYYIRDIIAIIFVSLIFAAALNPWVDSWAKYKVPRGVSALLFFIIFIAAITIIITLLIPPLTEQAAQFSANLPSYSEKVGNTLSQFKLYASQHGQEINLSQLLKDLSQYLSNKAIVVFGTIFNIIGGLAAFVLVLVITFYLLVEEDAIKRAAKFLVPENYQVFFADLVTRVQQKIASWLKAQFILSFIIGLLVYLGLLILDVEYALILALVAFICEFVPYIGPIIAAAAAIFVAFIKSPILALFVLILFIIFQQAENYVLVPKIMQRAVGLNPIISIIAVMVGFKIAGLAGLVLAIPVATAAGLIAKEIFSAKNSVRAR